MTVFAEVNGIRLFYETVGEGRPLVMLHGNGEDHTIFAEAAELLGERFACYLLDSRGHGQSTPVSELHYADMAEDTCAFIAAMGLRKPALYGHSDGGIIGLLLEITHPGTLGMLAVSGTNLSPAGLIPSFIEEFSAANRAHPDPLVTLMLTEPRIPVADLEKIRIPVLVTAGEHDLVLRSETEKIAGAIPGAEMVIVEKEDHGSYVVGSGIMGELLVHFLKKNR
jgi:pimeloyl-ACP methyl ester carboxylesterase